MAFQIGDRAGDYEIIGILGAGGMGKVYKVRNVLSNRIEAMKVVLPGHAENEQLADRFLREIRVQATLEHPNIASLHTAQRLDNEVLMIIEYVEGTSLGNLLEREGRLSLNKALDYISQVLNALEYAHARGVIHRDVKPANIIVTPAGLVKLMDFGIAKLAEDRKLTMTGSTIGSLHYMSPEQIQGADTVDARSDLYSLGICMYEIVTGKPPFDANSEYALMAAHLKESPRPPIELDATLPASLNEIMLMSIAKNPGQRFQSAAAMRSALNLVRQELGGGAGIIGSTIPHTHVQVPPPHVLPPTRVEKTPPPTREEAPSRSRRGLYIGAGSLIAAGLLMAALVFVPKYGQTGATTGDTRSASRPSAAEPSKTTPTGGIYTAPVESKVKSADADTIPASAIPDLAKMVTPDTARSGNAQSSRQAGAGTNSAPRSMFPARSSSPPTPRSAIAQNPSAQGSAGSPTSSEASQGAPPPTQPQPQHEVAPPKPGLSEAREQYNQLTIRANTAKGGLQSFQSQMGGLGLRADMLEARNRMDYLMQEVLNNIRAGDVDAARRNMDLADRSIEKIEKFLGR